MFLFEKVLLKLLSAITNIRSNKLKNGKRLKDYLVRANLPKLDESGRFEPCGKKIARCVILQEISRLLLQK